MQTIEQNALISKLEGIQARQRSQSDIPFGIVIHPSGKLVATQRDAARLAGCRDSAVSELRAKGIIGTLGRFVPVLELLKARLATGKPGRPRRKKHAPKPKPSGVLEPANLRTAAAHDAWCRALAAKQEEAQNEIPKLLQKTDAPETIPAA